MLNGRCNGSNDYTSVSTKGLAVVDYVIVSQDIVHRCEDVTVTRAGDIFTRTGLVSCCDTSHNLPDHSLVLWKINISQEMCRTVQNCEVEAIKIIKYDVSNVPIDFMCNDDTYEHMYRLSLTCSESTINASYATFCSIVKYNMNSFLSSRHIVIGEHKQPHHSNKPWWSVTLTELWNSKCELEQVYCNSSELDKFENRAIFIAAQKLFDRAVSNAKRQYWYQEQQHLMTLTHSGDFWKKIGKFGIKNKSNKSIPWEIVNEDGSISTHKADVIERWRNDFELLLNPPDIRYDGTMPPLLERLGERDTSMINEGITTDEVRYAVRNAGMGKAVGDDDIPTEVLNNETCIIYLQQLFNICFTSGEIPESWTRGIINPIPKKLKEDQRNPQNYRGITITSSVYKLYCYVLNRRLTQWADDHNVLFDEQNGFRSGRCTVDHIGSLTHVVEHRIKKKQSTYAAFIDFSKAYDRIDRNLLWHKLSHIGVAGYMLQALKSLYQGVKCTVRVNGYLTEWFSVTCGLKQGCILSPLLFNLYANDLIQSINCLEQGVPINDRFLSILLYADDIVLLSDTPSKLQTLLNRLGVWCAAWGLTINESKSKVIHFRPKSGDLTSANFICGGAKLDTVSQYKYLGLIITEHLDFLSMVKMVSQAASRALGLLIAKDKSFGGMPYNVYTKCYDAIVQATINYGASVFGTTKYSCIEAVQNRACRYFLGLGKYAPTVAISGDMGWSNPQHRLWLCVIRQWCKLLNMDNSLLTKKVFMWGLEQSGGKCKTWFYRVTQFLNSLEQQHMCQIQEVNTKLVIGTIKIKLDRLNECQWSEKLNSDTAVRGEAHGGNKLRTYRRFKNTYSKEDYVQVITHKRYRSAYAKFRCGVAPLKIETCRYGLNRLPVEQRVCEECDLVEDEFHVLMICPLYENIRTDCLRTICSITNGFTEYPIDEQFTQMMSNILYYKPVSKAMYTILNKRRISQYQ